MKITQHETLDEPTTAAAWELYLEVFEPLATRAAQNHVMTRETFGKVCAEPAHIKLLAHNTAGELVGVATITNNLEAMDLITHISIPYFQHHWPEHYDRQAIWYVGFVGVRQYGDTRNAFRNLLLALHDRMNSNQGISVQDYCRYNVEVQQVARVTEMLFARAGRDVRTVQVDDQSTWILQNSQDES